jgi:voltage-gated potassium channel Kch
MGFKIIDTESARLLTVAVALSMALTPVSFIILTNIILPRYAEATGTRPADDPNAQSGAVLLAGFGRYGQAAGRLLKANGIDCTVLDLDYTSIEMLRRHGLSVFYGDAVRPELLHAAGIEKARLLIIAVDDDERSERIAEIAKRHHPHLKIIARASDTRHAKALVAAGVAETVCEATASAIELGVVALQQLGFGKWRAARAGRRFRAHERDTQIQLFEAWGNQQRVLSVNKERVNDLEALLDIDDRDPLVNTEQGWDPPITRTEK